MRRPSLRQAGLVVPLGAGRGSGRRARPWAALLAALVPVHAVGDLRDGPHVEMLDNEGSHVLGEPQIHSVHGFRNDAFDEMLRWMTTITRTPPTACGDLPRAWFPPGFAR